MQNKCSICGSELIIIHLESIEKYYRVAGENDFKEISNEKDVMANVYCPNSLDHKVPDKVYNNILDNLFKNISQSQI